LSTQSRGQHSTAQTTRNRSGSQRRPDKRRRLQDPKLLYRDPK
jgi:hypothetical protein